MEEAGTQAIAVNDSEKMTEEEQILAKFNAYLDKVLMPSSVVREEDSDDFWSPEECAKRGWKECQECLKGTCSDSPPPPERVVKKGEVETIVLDGCEKTLPKDEVTNLIDEVRDNMDDDMEFYAFLDSLYPKRPLALEECDNASSLDELVKRGGRTVQKEEE